eukprot:13658538-Heterocapsa_arctica.AAC.1
MEDGRAIPSIGASCILPRLVAPGACANATERRSCIALSRSRMIRSLPSRPFSMCTLKSPATKVSMPTGGLLASSAVSTDSRSSGG